MHHFEIYELINATWETIYMVFIAGSLSILFGFIVGIGLFFTANTHWKSQIWHQTIGSIVNAIRSIPFIILLISILPLTRLLVGTSIGIHAAIIPLTLAAIPFFARLTENAFNEVPKDVIETAHAFGANHVQVLFKVLIPESLPTLIKAMALTIIGLIGYSAMAGAVGGGGLGELAINYGYQRFNPIITLETVIILILLVQFIQWSGDYLAKHRYIKPLVVAFFFLTSCCAAYSIFLSSGDKAHTIRIGVMNGWSEDIMKIASDLATKEYNLNIKVMAFNDYDLPNRALQDGSIDANIFQHVPYLIEQNKARHYNLKAVAKTFVYPMGFYSNKIKQISELKDNSLIALPNDPSNEARALLLLEKFKLIKLDSSVGTQASIQNIINNPKHLHFKIIDAAQVPRALPDVAMGAITNDYLSATGLSLKQAILKEGTDSLYANVITVRENEVNKDEIQQLIRIMHSKQILEATQHIFPNGAAIPAW